MSTTDKLTVDKVMVPFFNFNWEMPAINPNYILCLCRIAGYELRISQDENGVLIIIYFGVERLRYELDLAGNLYNSMRFAENIVKDHFRKRLIKALQNIQAPANPVLEEQEAAND